MSEINVSLTVKLDGATMDLFKQFIDLCTQQVKTDNAEETTSENQTSEQKEEKKKRRTKKEIEEDNIKAAMATSAAGPLGSVPVEQPKTESPNGGLFSIPGVSVPENSGFDMSALQGPVNIPAKNDFDFLGTAAVTPPAVTNEMIKELAAKIAQDNNNAKYNAVVALVRSYGMPISNLPADKWNEFYAKLQAL